jgi:hypothetical protein
VHVFQAAQHLVEEELVVLLRQVVVGLDHLVQVRLHELEDNVNVAELARLRREHDVLDLHNVRVLQLAQQHDLTQNARRVLAREGREEGGREGAGGRGVVSGGS